jgi:hypothetical protein
MMPPLPDISWLGPDAARELGAIGRLYRPNNRKVAFARWVLYGAVLTSVPLLYLAPTFLAVLLPWFLVTWLCSRLQQRLVLGQEVTARILAEYHRWQGSTSWADRSVDPTTPDTAAIDTIKPAQRDITEPEL